MARAAVDRLLADVERIVGSPHVITDPERTRSYEVDWTGRFRGSTPAVIRPGTHDEVVDVVRACNEHRVAIVPQGGNTGLVGGGVALGGEVTLHLGRLDRLDDVDDHAAQVTVEAGLTLGRLHAHAASAGLAYGVDLAARDSATIGGTIATNAGGVHVLRHGATRQQVMGVRAVLGDGSSVSHLDGLTKDNTGYDLAGLLCGSEGTLGIVTAARLRLVPRHDHTVVALLAFASLADAVAAVAAARRRLDSLHAAEVMFRDGVELVASVLELPDPLPAPHPVYVLLEAADHVDPFDDLRHTVEAMPGVLDAAVAQDGHRQAELWRYRDEHTAAINTLGPPHKLDVTLPLARLAPFVEQVAEAIAAVAPDARVWLFGHIADGNIHVNVTGVREDDERVDDAVLELVAAFGGSISAEHGIGTAKKRWLHLNRTPAEIDAFRRIKHALDPNAILNPAVLLP